MSSSVEAAVTSEAFFWLLAGCHWVSIDTGRRRCAGAEGLGRGEDYREQRCAPRPNRPWGRSSNSRNPIWSGQLDLREDDYGADAPAGTVHKAPRGCSERGVAGARQFVFDGCRRSAIPYSNSGKRLLTGTVRGFDIGQALQTPLAMP